MEGDSIPLPHGYKATFFVLLHISFLDYFWFLSLRVEIFSLFSQMLVLFFSLLIFFIRFSAKFAITLLFFSKNAQYLILSNISFLHETTCSHLH